MNPTPLFEERVNATLAKCTAIFKERGGQYGDTWRHGQDLAMRAVARKLGCTIPEDAFRALKAAALYDTKYQRLEGGYQEDDITDGINYGAYLAAEVNDVLEWRQTVVEKTEQIVPTTCTVCEKPLSRSMVHSLNQPPHVCPACLDAQYAQTR